MIREGQIILFTFPRSDQGTEKLRPALVLRSLPGPYNDWLICMISTRLHQEVSGIDEVIHETDSDFLQTGLKSTSLIRIMRIAVVSSDILRGAIGCLTDDRLKRIRSRIALWISGATSSVSTEK